MVEYILVTGGSLQIYPLGKWVGIFQKNPVLTHWVFVRQIGGYFLKEPSANPLGICWANGVGTF
jgi:hypothetical protein